MNAPSLTVCHVNGIFSKEHGGPTISIGDYLRGQSNAGVNVRFRTLEGYPGTSPAVRLPVEIDQKVFQIDWPAKLGHSFNLKAHLTLESAPDIFHLHGAWLLAMHYAYRQAMRKRVPYVIQLCGAYQLYELRRKPLRKWIARRIYQDRMLHRAKCLHVNSRREASEMRSLGFMRPIFIIPTGFDMAARDAFLANPLAVDALPELGGKRFILYLARIHPNKGIEVLLEAWKAIERRHPDVVLLVVGAGDVNYVQQVKAKARELGLEKRCIWRGFVSEREKYWCYQNAVVYCLPSFTENFGATIQEALGFGSPVITTANTPWTDLESKCCGWVREPHPDATASAVEAALCASPQDRMEMSGNARIYVEREFSLKSVIEKQLRMYQWMLGGEMPGDILYEK